MLQRNRATPGIEYEKSSTSNNVRSTWSAVSPFLMESMNSRRWLSTTGGDSTARIWLLMRKSGDAEVCRCTSDAPCSTANRINWSKFIEKPPTEDETRFSLAQVACQNSTHSRRSLPAGID